MFLSLNVTINYCKPIISNNSPLVLGSPPPLNAGFASLVYVIEYGIHCKEEGMYNCTSLEKNK